MIELTLLVLLVALIRAWYLIRTSRMPTIKDTQEESTIEPYGSPGNSFTIINQHERHKHYKKVETGGHSPPVHVEKKK